MNTRWNRQLLPSGTILTGVLFLLGLCLATGSALWWQQEIDREAEAQFQRSAERVSAEVSRRFLQPIYGLNGAKGVYAASQGVGRTAFRDYVESHDLPNEFPGVRGFGFIQRVMRPELDSFVAAERADGAPQFAIRQLGDKEHEDLFVIKFIDPAANNVGAQGLDIGSEALRRAAAQLAIDTGKPTITAAITLVQDNRKTPGVLLYVPVYTKGTHPSTTDERRTSLIGLLYAPIVIAELLEGMPDVGPGRMNFELIDSAPGTPGGPRIYESNNLVANLPVGKEARTGGRYSTTQALPLLGRELTLRVNSTPGFDATIDRSSPWLVFAGLALLSALLALLVRQQATGRHRAELLAQHMTEQLRQDEERSRDFSRSASDWFWETDAQHRFCYFSDNFEKVYGLAPGQLLGKNRKELLGLNALNPPEMINAHLSQLEAHLPFRNFEYQVRINSGALRWIAVSGLPHVAADGRFAGYRGTGTVITERKQSEEVAAELGHRISQLNQRLSLAADSARIGVWDYFVPENKLIWDKWMYALYGVREEDFSGAYQAWQDGLHPDDKVRGDEEINQALRGEKEFDTEFRVLWPNGELRYLKATALVVRDAGGKPLRMTGVNFDITERRLNDLALQNRENLLRENRAQLRLLLDSTGEAIYGIDMDGNCTFCNQSCLNILGYTRVDELIGKNMHYQIHSRHADGSHLPVEDCRIFRAFLKKETSHVDDEVLWRADGTCFAAEYWSYPQVVDDKTVGAVVSFLDISARKRAEMELLRSNSELAQFSYAISHDMRQPLRMISSYLQLLEMELGGQLDGEKREYFSFAIDGAKRLDAMMVGLLECSRIGRKGEPLSWTESRDLLDEALMFLQPAVAEAQAGVRIEGDWPRFLVSPDEMLRLIQNLIGNALKFHVAGRTPEITVSSEIVDERWRLCVADNGIGILPDQIGRLFEVFQRLQSRAAYEGTGIGLALCRKIAEHHGGKIWVESAGEGQGSQFFVELPMPDPSLTANLSADPAQV